MMSDTGSRAIDSCEAAAVGGAGRRPRVYYGWVMLGIALLGVIATSPGQTYGVAAFNDSFRQSLGLTHSQLTGAYMVGTLLACLPMGFIGALSDRYGIRHVKMVVVLLFAGACVVTALAQGFWTLFLAFFLLRMLGQGALGLLSTNTLPFWFERRLGTADGMRRLGVAGAIAVVPPMNLWLIDAVGWRWAYALLGVAVVVMLLPLLQFCFHNRPEDIGQVRDGLPPGKAGGGSAAGAGAEAGAVEEVSFTLRQAMRTRTFWIVAGSLSVWGMVSTGLQFNVVPLLQSRGLTAGEAATLFSTFAVSLAVMHVVGGLLADRVPLNLLLTAAIGALAATVWGWRAVGSVETVLAVGMLMGATQGLLTAAASALWPRYFGRGYLGRIRGTVTTLNVGSTSVGPFLLGLGHDWLGSFDPVITLFAFLPLPFLLLAPFATRPGVPGADEETLSGAVAGDAG